MSKEAHANIVSVAPSRALQMAGVVDYINAADVPGSNLYGVVERTEEIFATKEVSYFIGFDILKYVGFMLLLVMNLYSEYMIYPSLINPELTMK